MNKSIFQLGGLAIGPAAQLPPNYRRRVTVEEEVLRCSGFQVDIAADGTADGRMEICPSNWQQPVDATGLQLR